MSPLMQAMWKMGRSWVRLSRYVATVAVVEYKKKIIFHTPGDNQVKCFLLRSEIRAEMRILPFWIVWIIRR